MRVFEPIDAYDGFCKEHEVGLPWEPRWGIADISAGRCPPTSLGKRRPGTPPPMTPDDLPDPDPDEVDSLPLEFIYERELRAYHRDADEYRAKAGANLRLLLEFGERRRAEIEAQARSDVELSFEQFDKLSTSDANRRIFDYLLSFVPQDHPRWEEAHRMLGECADAEAHRMLGECADAEAQGL